MEVAVRNKQNAIRISPRRIEGLVRRVLTALANRGSIPLSTFGGGNALRQRVPLQSVEVSVLLVGDEGMRRLNVTYRGIHKGTDVLSFPQWPKTPGQEIAHPGDGVLGDIVVNLCQAKRQAKDRGVGLYEEVTWLLVHGLLHLIGHDHEASPSRARVMRSREQRLLNTLLRER